MQKRFFWLSLATFLLLFACTQNKPSQPPTAALAVVKMEEKTMRKCARDSTVCAEVTLRYPTLSSERNVAAISAINEALREKALTGLEANPKMSVEQALDSVQKNLLAMLKEHLKMSPDWDADYTKGVNTETLLNSARFVSFEMTCSGFTGGAHPYYHASLTTYNLSSGQPVQLSDIVRDTAALRPMLEEGFVDAKKEAMPDATLADLLFPELTQLPLPTNVCIVPDGLRFFYNPYEVAPWAVGPTEITLTWEQLRDLVERGKWVD